MFESVSIIGGDLRQVTVAHFLQEHGYQVSVFGLDKEVSIDHLTPEKEAKQAFQKQMIVLPVPVSFDGSTINAPFSSNPIEIKAFLEQINPAAFVFGGRFSDTLSALLEEKGIAYRDYLKREELAIKNAVPTAEGAIEIAMSEIPITLHQSHCLVMGYGRIGKILSKMLAGIGAKVTVEARKFADLALIDGHGYESVHMNDLKEKIGMFDVVFNTIPTLVLDEEILKQIRKDTLVIDLASKPGGVDFEAAKQLGIRVIWALSLPREVTR